MSLRSIHSDSDRPTAPVRAAAIFWLIGALVVAFLIAIWLALPALLVAFASVIVAVMLIAVARPLERLLGLRYPFALAMAGVVLLTLPVVACVLVGPQLKVQLAQVAQQIPAAIESIEHNFGIDLTSIVKDATGSGSPGATTSGGRSVISDAVSVGGLLLSNLSVAGSFVMNALAGLLIVIFGGFYLASDPQRYRQGFVRLFPPRHQEKMDSALDHCGRALERWLIAQAIAMTAVGMMAGLGSWALGLPAPLAIGVISGILEFFPVVGPWLGAVPVLLLAFGQGLQVMILAALMLLVIQQVEANLITPLVQQTFAEIPPFLVLFGLVVFGLIFGLAGVLVAGPLTLVAYVLVVELYVNDTLGQDLKIPGETDSEESVPSA